MRLLPKIMCAFAVIGFVACEGGGLPPKDTQSGTGDTIGAIDPGTDVLPDDGTPGRIDIIYSDTDEPDSADPDAPTDIDADSSDIKEVEDVGGGFGSFCNSNDDCLSGLCVPSEIGYICTMTCEANCPEQWECKAVNLGGQDTVFVCLPGMDLSCEVNAECEQRATENEPCGNCGTKTRTCSDYCKWSVWSQCVGEGECPVGAIQDKDCGLCGQTSRTCSDLCRWGAWSDCEGEGVCEEGDQETEDCGKCGQRSRNCTRLCQWGNWSLFRPSPLQ